MTSQLKPFIGLGVPPRKGRRLALSAIIPRADYRAAG